MENRILEVYFEPFLRYRPKHRWPDQQRRAIAKRRNKPDPAYFSPVLTHRVFVWPSKTIFFAISTSLAAGLWLFGSFVARGRKSLDPRVRPEG